MQETCLGSAGAMPQVAWHAPAPKPWEPQAAERRSPPGARRAQGHSGRAFCHIYPKGSVWVLELKPVSGGWLHRVCRREAGDNANTALRFTFPTLGAAIGYAEQHGIDYRIIWRPQHRRSERYHRATALPRCWMARLSRNGRNGDAYHG